MMMKETIDLLGKIFTNILTALYEPFGFSLLLSFLVMFFYLYAYEPAATGRGWKNAIVTWYQKFKESVFFRKLFLLAFVTSMILFRTLLNRNLWMNPLSDVMGGWGIWETVNDERQLTTECIENVIMMVPFSAVVMWTFEEKIGKGWKKILWYSGEIRSLADELNISLLKLRKLLITADAFTSDICTEINALHRSGKKIPEIMKVTGLYRASVHSYLPYTKGLYNAAEISLNAERSCTAESRILCIWR